MAGTINSLGIGSGVLTADVIDQLKENDKAQQITPIDSKISLEQQKGDALDLLKSLMDSFQASVSSLDYDVLYQERTVSGNNSGVSVTAEAGVGIQSFSVDVTTLAKSNVLQSGAFGDPSDTFASVDGILNLNVGGTNYEIDYDTTMTLEDLKTEINTVAGDAVTASILRTGDSAYSLVITSDETGKDQAISLTNLSGTIDSKLVSDAQVSGTFAGTASSVATGAGQMNINVGGTDYQIDYTDGMSLQTLADTINADASLGSVLGASVVQYGTNDYRLVLSAKEATQDQAITITDLGPGVLDANLLNAAGTSVSGDMNVVQDAVDAAFLYNGIEMTRSSNTVTDIALGMTINLLNEGESANISITQDTQKVADELSSMVTSYNTLISQLDDMTLSDLEAGQVGIFNGDNTIKNISREISRIITSVSDEGYSLAQFGIGLEQDGTMTFDETEFTTKFEEDPEMAEAYFSGATVVDTYGNDNTIEGVFTRLNDLLDSYVGVSGFMNTLVTSNSSTLTSLQEERTRAMELIDARYEAMTARFVQYDAIISRLNNQFSVLQQQIEMAINANN